MALTDEGTNTTMLVQPSGFNNGGFGGFGGDGWWLILLLLCGWGGFGGGFGGGYGNMMLGYDFPWLLNGQNGINANVNNGFRDAMINDGINSIGDKVTTGFGNVATQLCNGFAGVNANITNSQMANMQSIFGVQSALQNCCCESRAGIADLKYTVATENCADRTAAYQNTRDIIDSQTRGTQAILDKLCQLELDGVKQQVDAKNDRIVDLQNQLNMAALRESQTAQNAFISQGFANEVDALYNRLNNCPVSAVPVYGKQPIFQCNNGGCGCGVA